MRSSISSRPIRTEPEATGVDEASAAIFCPPTVATFRPMWRRARARQRISIVGSCLCSRSRLHRGVMQICSLRSFTTALITLFVTLGLATSAVSQARTAGRFRCGTALRALSGWHSRTLHYRIRSLRPRKRLWQRSRGRRRRSCERGSRQTLSCWFASTISGAGRRVLFAGHGSSRRRTSHGSQQGHFSGFLDLPRQPVWP